MPVVRAMLAGVGPQDVVYDLGSGDGRIVLTQDRVEFRQGDMYAADLSAATVGR